jgi:hypothetical protein
MQTSLEALTKRLHLTAALSFRSAVAGGLCVGSALHQLHPAAVGEAQRYAS